MKKKFYFENEDAEDAHSEAFFQEIMKSEGIVEMKVIEAIPVPHSKADYVYCTETDNCFEKSECSKSCATYKPLNAKSERCKFRGQYCDYGEEVILKIGDIPFEKAKIQVIANGLFGLTTSIIPQRSGKIPVWYSGNSYPEFVDIKHVQFKISGMELIMEERREQIEKHKWPITSDEWYGKDQLIRAAEFCLSQAKNPIDNSNSWPEGWDKYYEDKIRSKDTIGKLKVAGAFYLAEIDRKGDHSYLDKVSQVAIMIDELQHTHS